MPTGQAKQGMIVVDGHDRHYLAVGDGSPHPRSLLLAFHGSGGSAAQFRKFTGGGFDHWAEDGLGTVVYLDSWRKGLWNDARISSRSRAREDGVDDVAFVRAVIRHFQAEEKDVFAAGYSNGGQMVIHLLHDAPQILSAAALIGATVPSPENLLGEGAAEPVPMLLIHGTKDPLVPYDGGMASIFGFRPRGMMRSAPDSARYWATRNGIDTQPEVSTIPSDRARPRTVTRLHSFGESSAAPVHFYSVEGGGHVVPNPRTHPNPLLGRSSAELNAPAAILDFFRAHGQSAPQYPGVHPLPHEHDWVEHRRNRNDEENRVFTGLSAFPLTPISDDRIDEDAFAGLIRRLADAGVDSIGALGSTGSYAYLDRAERARAAAIAAQNAGAVPVIIGVGSVRTRDVLAFIDDAQNSGAAGVLLPAMTYQHLSDEEVFGLYADAAAFASVPIVVYDNPGTTHTDFSDELHGRIAQLPGIASIKIPPVPLDLAAAGVRVDRLRALIPGTVGIGVSGDEAGATGLLAGCDTWYSGIAGILPEPCLAITRAAADGNVELALTLSTRLDSFWTLQRQYGGYRVAAAIAENLGLATAPSLPRPVRGLDDAGRRAVAAALDALGVTA